MDRTRVFHPPRSRTPALRKTVGRIYERKRQFQRAFERTYQGNSNGQIANDRVGVIGYGYWGPNVVRNFFGVDHTRVEMLCDMNPSALARAKKNYPRLEVTTNPDEILKSTRIDAVAVVTPVWTHYELAKAALENGKHVFVEKPFTSTSEQAEELIELAARKNLKIMVDHTFLFTGAVSKIRELTETARSASSTTTIPLRVNLGLFQHDVNVIWDLAPHDLSIMDHLIKGEPEAIVRHGESHLNGVEDVAFMTIYFPNNVIAHINVNWLSPVKVRTTLIGGEKKMLVWNDLEADEKIKVYDKGVQHHVRRESLRVAGELPLRRHVGAADRTARSAARGTGLFRRLHCPGQDAFQRWRGRPARGAHAGSGRPVHQAERRIGAPVNEHCSIAPDVKLGKDVKLSKFINLYGCEIGDETKIGAFVEIQKNASGRQALQDLQPHVRLRRRDHRGQRFHRPRRDVHQRHLSARHRRTGNCRPKPTGKSSGRWSRRARRSARAPRSWPMSPSAKTRSSARAAWSPKMFPPTASWREIRRKCCARSNPPWRP